MPERAEPVARRAPEARAVQPAPTLARAEQEAQRVAERVAQQPAPGLATASAALPDGAALPPSLRRFMESQFGVDLAHARLHTGEHGEAKARHHTAAAVTQGRDVFFARGQFRPDTLEGRGLIAHELAHTLQQGERPAGFTPEPNGQAQASSRGIVIAGRQLFITRHEEMVPLPGDMTIEQAAKLEDEGLAAERRLGQLPPAPAVPDVRRLAPTPKAAPTAKPAKRGARRGGYRNTPAPEAKELTEALMASAGERQIARYLAQQGAPVLLRGVQHLQRLKRNEQKHDDAQAKRGQSEQAVVVPPTEEQSHGNTNQVQGLADRQDPTIDVGAGKSRLQDSLRSNLPRSLEALDNFKKDSRARLTGAHVGLVIHADKNAVVAGFGEVRTTPAPVPTDHVTQELPPEEAAPSTPAINPGRGLVAQLLPQHTDLSQYSRDANKKLQEEGVTQEQLDMVDKGELAEANRDKRQLERNVATQPAQMQAMAKQEATEADKTLGEEAARGRAAMRSHRKQGLGRTGGRQRNAKKTLEQKRDDVAREINRIYTTAQDSVKRKLADLETRAMQTFDRGNEAAAKAFEDDVKRELDAYKADRYSGFFGRLRRAKDWLLGMDDLPRVKQIFETNRAAFVRTIDKLVESIGAENQRVIAECKAELATARERISGYVAGLEPALQGIGKEAAGEMSRQLDALDRSIDQKEQALRQQLQEKQQAAIKAIDEKIEKMKEEMSGALAKLGRLLLWAAKKFFTWALGQFGYSLSDIEQIIAKGVAVLKAIFTQPIRFVGNLIRAAKEGIALFSTNFPTHLKDALFEWLTGSLTGIKLPQVWDARGILGVVLQVLDLSGDALKRKVLRKLGGDERMLEQIEKSWAIASKLIKEGPAAAWEEIKAQAEELRQQAEGELRTFVALEIVKRATLTIALLFTPGAGVVRAIIGIYDTIVFFIQRARDIARMVASFLGSIAEIAAGNVAAAAKALENGLARALRLVIDFLARFLKLSGIPKMLRSVIEKVRTRTDALIDRVVDWILKMGRAAIAKVKQGAAAVKKAITRWWNARRDFKTDDQHDHSLFFRGEDTGARLMLRSDEEAFSDWVEKAKADTDPRKKAKAAARTIAASIDTERATPPKGATDEDKEKDRARKATLVNELLDKLVPHTRLLFKAGLPDSFPGEVNEKPNKQDFGAGMKVVPLTMIKRPKGEGPTSSQNTQFELLNARRESPGGASFYIKGHLLNETLGGPGGWKNLTPLSRSGNAQHEVQAEAVVKRSVDAAAIVQYEVKPVKATRGDKAALLKKIDAGRDPADAKREKTGIVEAEDYVPQALDIKAKLLDESLKPISSMMVKTIENPVPRDYDSYFLATTPKPQPVNLSEDTAAMIATVPGISLDIAKLIVAKRKKLPGERFSTYAQLEEVKGIGEKRLETLESEGHIKLYSRK